MYPRTIICNNCEQMNVLGDILNDGGNDECQEEYEFTVSFFKFAPTIINDITKKKLIYIKLVNMISQREI